MIWANQDLNAHLGVQMYAWFVTMIPCICSLQAYKLGINLYASSQYLQNITLETICTITEMN